jgi:hypothetical protein
MRRAHLLPLIAALPLLLAGNARAEEQLREIYFLDLIQNRSDNTIVVEANPETEILVFNGGQLALENRNLIVVARHARIDADTSIKSFSLVTRLPRPGRPPQAETGTAGTKEAPDGRNGNTGVAGAPGDNGSPAGKVVLRIGEISGTGRLIVDLSGQDGGKGQSGSQGGDGGKGLDGANGTCGENEARKGGDGGWGGIGGQGGPGGRGGNGGILIYSTALESLIERGQFAFTTKAGQPGAGGDPGEPGQAGPGGAGGSATQPCAGGKDGALGGRLYGASPGQSGAPGRDGSAAMDELQ